MFLNFVTADVRDRVRACVSVLGLEDPPQLDPTTGMRNWYKDHSLVLVPATHSLHDDARRTGKHQKKYGNIFRPAEGETLEGRPIHLLEASLPQIKTFVSDKLARKGKKATPTASAMSASASLGTAELLGPSRTTSASTSGNATPSAAPVTSTSVTTAASTSVAPQDAAQPATAPSVRSMQKDADGDVVIKDAQPVQASTQPLSNGTQQQPP